MMEEKNDKRYSDVILSVVFVGYLLFLVWIVLFKLSMPWEIGQLEGERVLNLTPFRGVSYGFFNTTEFWGNVAVFVPLGVYVCLLFRNLSFVTKLLVPFVASVALEVFQYVLAIGVTDITDVILNGFGGMLGMLFFYTICLFNQNLDSVKRIIAALSLAAGVPSAFALTALVVLHV